MSSNGRILFDMMMMMCCSQVTNIKNVKKDTHKISVLLKMTESRNDDIKLLAKKLLIVP